MPILWTQIFAWPKTLFHAQQRQAQETRPSTLVSQFSPSSLSCTPASQLTFQPFPSPPALTNMTTSLSPSPFQDQITAPNEAVVELLDTKKGCASPPTPFGHQASQDNAQHEHITSCTPTSAQDPSITAVNQPRKPHSQSVSRHSSVPNTLHSTPIPNSETVTSLLVPEGGNILNEAMSQPNSQADDLPSPTSSPGSEQQQTEVFDPHQPFSNHDWDDLETRFQAKMAECAKVEEGIEAEFQALISVRSFVLPCHGAV